jgi:hydrogenase maturation protease
MARILVAGVGNLLRGDDGFGVRAAQALARDPRRPAHVEVLETGIGGMSLVQQLMDGFDALILLDAVDRGAASGQVFVLEPQLPDLSGLSAHERRDYFSDTHYATPVRALCLAASLGHLPKVVRIVGCQPARTDEFEIGLAPGVEGAITRAIDEVLTIVAAIGHGPRAAKEHEPADDPPA